MQAESNNIYTREQDRRNIDDWRVCIAIKVKPTVIINFQGKIRRSQKRILPQLRKKTAEEALQVKSTLCMSRISRTQDNLQIKAIFKDFNCLYRKINQDPLLKGTVCRMRILRTAKMIKQILWVVLIKDTPINSFKAGKFHLSLDYIMIWPNTRSHQLLQLRSKELSSRVSSAQWKTTKITSRWLDRPAKLE